MSFRSLIILVLFIQGKNKGKTNNRKFTKVYEYLAISAGGDKSCDATYWMTINIFSDFNKNLTETMENCTQVIANVAAMSPPLEEPNVTKELDLIYTDCANSFIGYLMEVVTVVSDMLHVDPNEMLDIITGGVRTSMTVPLKCIGNELTSMFPDIMNANGELATKIDLITHP